MKYQVVHNHCNCHPETCCCNPHAVVNELGKKVITFFFKEEADEYCEYLNNKETYKNSLDNEEL